MSKSQKPMWPPYDGPTQISDFMAYVNSAYQLKLKTYNDLQEWSVNNIDQFWTCLAKTFDLSSNQAAFLPTRESQLAPEEPMLGWKWFPNMKLNYAEYTLTKMQKASDLIIGQIEDGPVVNWSKDQVASEVLSWSKYLKEMGVKPGDKVAGVCANTPEAIIGFLATVTLGAVWSSCSPDFGEDAILDRLDQIDCKVLFWSSRYSYKGRLIDTSPQLKNLIPKLSHLKAVICLDHSWNFSVPSSPLEAVPKNLHFKSWDGVPKKNPSAFTPSEFEFYPCEFADPMLIVFSSGTTGLPKCIIHSVGGTLLQHLKELKIHVDLSTQDRLFFFTTCGWMMWNWMVSALPSGAKLLVYDGSPVYPNKNILWALVEEKKVTVFGLSPKYLSLCMQNDSTRESNQITEVSKKSLLRLLLSTGAPLLENHYDWVYERFSGRVPISSISGGTDILSCFLLSCPLSPIYSGQLQAAGLGMKVEIWDSEKPEKQDLGKTGELVCTQPFVSMPLGFLGDGNDQKYRSTYFEKYPNKQVWHHGDFAYKNTSGSFVILGRSDSTLNPGGVRIGTAEIYRVLESFSWLEDSIVFGFNQKDDIKVVALLVLKKANTLDTAHENTLRSAIRKRLSPRHVPDFFFSVTEIPYTRSGKKMEILCREIFSKKPSPSKISAANPEVLSKIEALADLL